MNFSDIERTLGPQAIDRLMSTALSVISGDPDAEGYAERLTALQSLLTGLLALCATRSGTACADAGDALAQSLRVAVGKMAVRDIAVRETGPLNDFPASWREVVAGGARPCAKRLVQAQRGRRHQGQ